MLPLLGFAESLEVLDSAVPELQELGSQDHYSLQQGPSYVASRCWGASGVTVFSWVGSASRSNDELLNVEESEPDSEESESSSELAQICLQFLGFAGALPLDLFTFALNGPCN